MGQPSAITKQFGMLLRWQVYSPDGKRLAAASADETVQIYTLDIRELLDLARSRVTRTPPSLTPDECKRYFVRERPPLHRASSVSTFAPKSLGQQPLLFCLIADDYLAPNAGLKALASQSGRFGTVVAYE
jgi:hypothetical protein